MFFKSMTEEEKAEQTIGVLQGLYNAYKLHIVDDEFMFAVKEIGKAAPKEPIRKKMDAKSLSDLRRRPRRRMQRWLLRKSTV